MRQSELTDEQWAIIAPLIPNLTHRASRRGRPLRHLREVLSGILWVLRYNARWEDLPEHFPAYQTCHRRFQQWMRDGTLRNVLEALEKDLRDRGGFEVTEWLKNYRAAAANDDEHEQNRSNGCSSWQQRTAMLFLSRSMLMVLYRLKSPLARKLSQRFTWTGSSALAPLALLSVCQLAEAGPEVSVLEALIR